MTAPPRTVTLPEEERPPALDPLDGSEVISSIREYGHGIEHPLLGSKRTHTVGSSPGCDILVTSDYVSSLHCVLDRRAQRIRVHDQATRNGTYFHGRQEMTFDIGPGDMFMVASTILLAANDSMRLARPALSQILGYEAHALVDDVLVAAIQDAPLLVVAPHGAGQSRVIAAIHEASLRRRRTLVELSESPETRDEQKQVVIGARRGTLVINLSGTRFDQPLLEMALSPEFRVRPLVVAPSVEVAVRSLGPEALMGMQRVEIPSIREREGELGRLIDHLFIENQLSLRMSDLTANNQEAVTAHTWPHNFDELRETVTWMGQIVREGSIRKAAAAIDVPRSTLQYWLDRLGLELPLTRRGVPLDGDRPAPAETAGATLSVGTTRPRPAGRLK